MAAANDVVRRSNSDGTYTVGFVESASDSTSTGTIVVRPLATISSTGTWTRIGDAAAGTLVSALASAWSKIA